MAAAVGNSFPLVGKCSQSLPRYSQSSPTTPPGLFHVEQFNRRSFLVLTATALMGALFSACGGAKPDNALVVGMDLSYPPFETIGSSGEPEGVSVELARALAASMNRPLRIENIPFEGLIASLQSGRVDCVISSMTDTPERRKTIGFSDPYLTTGLAMLVGAETGIKSLADADHAGRRIVVRLGTTGEQWARKNLRNATILTVEKENAAVMEVMQGKSDAFIYDQMSVWKNQHEHPEETRAVLQPLATESWAIGVRQDDNVLRGTINAFLEAYRADGGFDRLGDRFLKAQKAAFAREGVPFVF